MAKLAGFQIKKYVEFAGRDGYGYNTELFLGQKKIAVATDCADGILECDVDWYGTQKDEKILKTTMEKIIESSENNLISGDTINECVQYMVELLLELNDFEQEGKEFFTESPKQNKAYFGIFNAWMSSEESGKDYDIALPGVINNKPITKKQAEAILQKKYGNLHGLIEMHKGKALDMSVVEYINIFKPYRHIQEPGMNVIDETR